MTIVLRALPFLAAASAWAAAVESPLERFVREARASQATAPYSAGSLYTPGSILGDLNGDFRGLGLNDLVTIVVSDRATALAKGTSNSKRSGSAKGSISALAGPVRGRILPNLARLEGEQQLDGQGETSREMSLTTTLTGRITHVFANGNFVVEGIKDVMVNAERQSVSVRGVGRWTDLSAANQIRSDRLGYLEIKVVGKGIVGDAIRRPNFLYRLLLGLLPI